MPRISVSISKELQTELLRSAAFQKRSLSQLVANLLEESPELRGMRVADRVFEKYQAATNPVVLGK